MKTISVRDLRQRWSETVRTLEVEHELTIAYHGKPVAKLVRLAEAAPKGKRWDPEVHLRWLKKVWENKVFGSSDAAIARGRADRWESEKS
jgi:antitoxin (DNA-binding transcriptional repressor) of toxin-antitoxin stability system